MAIVLAFVIHRWLGAALLAVIGLRAATLAWRARPSWGRRHRWPPGSVGVGIEPFLDPEHFAKQAERHGPVFKTNHFLDPMVCVVGLEATTELLGRDHLDDLTPVPAPYNRFVPGGMFRWREGANSSAPRLTFTRALSLRFVTDCEPLMHHAVALEGRRMAESTAAHGGVAPLPHIRELVLTAWAPMFLGIGPVDPTFDEVRELFVELNTYTRTPYTDDEVVERLVHFERLIRDAARAEPAGVTFAGELLALDPRALDDDATIRNLIYTTLTTREDVAGLLMWVLKHLSDHPEWVERLREAPDAPELADRIVSESLRLEQSEYLFRRMKRDIEFQGFVLPEGWLLRACTHESHRDPEGFDKPDAFEPDRFRDRRYRRDAYAPFGVDPRACTGDTVARRMARIFVLDLVGGFDWTVSADGPRELSRERHWAPSSKLHIAVQDRAPWPVSEAR